MILTRQLVVASEDIGSWICTCDAFLFVNKSICVVSVLYDSRQVGFLEITSTKQ